MIKRRSKTTFSVRGGLLLILLLTAAMPGCKEKTPPPPPQVTPLPKKTEQAAPVAVAPAKPVQTASSSARKTVASSPVQKQISTATRFVPPGTVSLDFTSKRDPFRPFVQLPPSQQPVGGRSAKHRGHDPLPIQSFDTESFKVSGIVTGLRENSALITDPKGKGYVVKAGMQIGNNDGYVKSVTNTTVEVEESFRDDNGRVRKRLVKLMLLRKK